MGYTKEMFILFLFVMLHEMAHVIFAVMYKLRVETIEIFPFGGVARIGNIEGVEAHKEIIIAMAGPGANIIAASIILALNRAGVSIPDFSYLMNVNITLALFNLLPGLPLDGGRMLRAALAYYTGFKKATRTSAVMGKIIAMALLFVGIIVYIYGNLNISLLVIPFFIFISAVNEENGIMYTIMKNITNKNSDFITRGVMDTTGICVYENVMIREVLKNFDLNRYHLIVVINSEMKIRAVFTESQVFEALSFYGGGVTLGELCEKNR